MKKHVLKLNGDSETSFGIIAISSHENDYRLSWALNNKSEIDFKRTDNYTVFDTKNDIEKEFALYQFQDEESFVKLLLIANQSEYGYLLPEMKNMDFFIIVLGEYDTLYINTLLEKIKQVEIVSMASIIEVSNLKSRKNLMFHQYE